LSSEFTKILKKTFVLARPRAGIAPPLAETPGGCRVLEEPRCAGAKRAKIIGGAACARRLEMQGGLSDANLRESVLERGAALDEFA